MICYLFSFLIRWLTTILDFGKRKINLSVEANLNNQHPIPYISIYYSLYDINIPFIHDERIFLRKINVILTCRFFLFSFSNSNSNWHLGPCLTINSLILSLLNVNKEYSSNSSSEIFRVIFKIMNMINYPSTHNLKNTNLNADMITHINMSQMRMHTFEYLDYRIRHPPAR